MLRWPGLNVRHRIWIRTTFYLSHLSCLKVPSLAVIHRRLVCWSQSVIEQMALSALSRSACFVFDMHFILILWLGEVEMRSLQAAFEFEISESTRATR